MRERDNFADGLFRDSATGRAFLPWTLMMVQKLQLKGKPAAIDSPDLEATNVSYSASDLESVDG